MTYDVPKSRGAVGRLTERVLLRPGELRGSTHVEVGGVGIVHTVAGAVGLNQVPAGWKLRDFQTDRACVLRRELLLIENLVVHPGGRHDWREIPEERRHKIGR